MGNYVCFGGKLHAKTTQWVNVGKSKFGYDFIEHQCEAARENHLFLIRRIQNLEVHVV